MLVFQGPCQWALAHTAVGLGAAPAPPIKEALAGPPVGTRHHAEPTSRPWCRPHLREGPGETRPQRGVGLGVPRGAEEGAKANLETGGAGRQCRRAGRGDGPTDAISVVPGRWLGPRGRADWVGVGWRPGAVPGRTRRRA